MTGETDDEPNPLFDTPAAREENEIWRNKELVNTGHVPDEERIVGRDEQIQNVANVVAPLVAGKPASSAMIFGKTGTGKSLVSKHVMSELADEANRRGTNVGTVYVNCSQTNGVSRVVRNIGDRIKPEDSGVKFPIRGISTDEYYERLWEVLDTHYNGAVITIDEVDQLKDDSPLMILSRARENGSIDIPISIIAISNKIDYRDEMNQRTKSSFGHKEFVFDPYDANQLREILRYREDAFQEGILDDGVIPRVSAVAAKEHGDARKGVELLYHLGEYAVENGLSRVTEEVIDEVREIAEADRLRELVNGLPPHSKVVVLALATLDKNNTDENWFRTTQIIDCYNRICEQEGTDPLSSGRVRQLLQELSFLKVTESKTNYTGHGSGTFNEHQILYEPDVVKRIQQ